jgi:hypothetical protein
VGHGPVRLLAIALLFLLPVVIRLKFGNVDIGQPAPPAPTMTELQPASWHTIERKTRPVATIGIVVGSAGTLPRRELAPALSPPPSSLATVASVKVKGAGIVLGRQRANQQTPLSAAASS